LPGLPNGPVTRGLAGGRAEGAAPGRAAPEVLVPVQLARMAQVSAANENVRNNGWLRTGPSLLVITQRVTGSVGRILDEQDVVTRASLRQRRFWWGHASFEPHGSKIGIRQQDTTAFVNLADGRTITAKDRGIGMK